WEAGSWGEGERGAWASVFGENRGGEALRIQVLADAVERLARITRREALKLGVDRVARADLDQAVAHTRVEAVQRAHRGSAGDHPAKVVDAAVTRTDESLRGGDEAHRTAQVHAARGQRHELVVLIPGLLVDGR